MFIYFYVVHLIFFFSTHKKNLQLPFEMSTLPTYNIFLAFRKAEKVRGCKNRCLDQIFNWWDGVYEGTRYKHVEIILEYAKGYQICYGSTSKDNGVHESEPNRSFTSPYYNQFLQCILSYQDFEKLSKFCKKEANAKDKSYDYDFAPRQILRCCMPPKPKHSYACSDFVCEALQRIGFVPADWDPEVTTTQTIWNYVSQDDDRWFIPQGTDLHFLSNGDV
jgi:hypothetical protein